MTKEDYFKYYIQGSDHYLIPKDVFDELFNEMESWREEAKELKKQLEYLRSGEYYNQLRFENEMLQQVVDTNGVPSEVYDYIDCTHRNTELLNQQKEFIKYLEDEIKQINPKILDDGELNLRLDDIKYTQYLTYKEILQKYKSIIGYDK